MKKLILIESGEKYQFDTVKELIESIIDEKYYEMSAKERREKLELKAYANCMPKREIEITDKIEKGMTINGKFIIYDEVTYIYSLLLLNKVVLLESTDSDMFTGDLDKSNISDNYIIVNHFAKDLLIRYIEKKGEN